jgi:probable F420-dependent oxidoreductase
MKIAVHFGATDQTADPGRVAHEAEIRGFEGIFFPEHTHMPVQRRDIPYPNNDERMVHYQRLYSPFTAMTWAAGATRKLTVGTCVSLPVEHDPIILAKTLASIDVMSGGRVVYGFGFGWLDEEMIDHGIDPKKRRAVTREKMLAARAIWTQDQPSFSGEHVRFPPCWCWPKPLQRPLPILLGAGGTDKVFDHVIEYCEGWMPPLHPGFLDNVKRLKSRAADAGRDPATVQVNILPRERSVKVFEQYRDAGVERVMLHLPFADIDGVRRALDAYATEFLTAFPQGTAA